MDVLEIDAATHTGVDNVREVIISGLGIMPVRDRLQGLHHRRSAPAVVVVVQRAAQVDRRAAAARRVHDGDDRARQDSRDGAVAVAGVRVPDDQRQGDCRPAPTIVDAEQIEVGDDSLQLIARDAEGSMRDAQSKLDQVIAFTGKTIARRRRGDRAGACRARSAARRRDGRGRRERAGGIRAAGRAVELGTTCARCAASCRGWCATCSCCRSIPRASNDPEIAGEGERDRLLALVERFSREDLLRAFDLLARAEMEIRSAAQPRYHLEMALLRWIHLRKLVPIEDLIAGAVERWRRRSWRVVGCPFAGRPAAVARRAGPWRRRKARARCESRRRPSSLSPPRRGGAARRRVRSRTRFSPRSARTRAFSTTCASRRRRRSRWRAIASTFTFSATQRALRDQFEQNRAWLESLAQQVSGRRIAVAARARGGRCRRCRASRPLGQRRRAATTRRPSCASRHWPTPASRRCSKCSRRKYGMWRKYEGSKVPSSRVNRSSNLEP